MSEAPNLAELRAMVYRVLSSALLPPTEERLATLVAAMPEIRARAEPLRGMAFFPGLDALLARIQALSEEEAERHRERYTTLFLAGARGAPPPYESAHLGPEADVAMIAAQVDAAYRAAGFVVGAEGEAPDHVAIELDFLSALCRREAEAEGRDAVAEAEGWRRTQRAFLLAHPLRWLPAFAAAVARSAPGSLLAETVEAARRFAEHDAALLESLHAEAG